MKLTIDKQSNIKWVCRSEVNTSNKYFPETAWVSISKDGITGESQEAVGTKAPSKELKAYALQQVIKLASVKPVHKNTSVASYNRSNHRSSCLNCGRTNTILMGRGYCTDCHGECD